MNDYLKELGELAEINEPVSETYYKGSSRIDTITPKYALLVPMRGEGLSSVTLWLSVFRHR